MIRFYRAYKKNDPELQDLISDEKKKINSELEFRKKRNDFYKARWDLY